jgi:hypothetical protein
MENQGLISLLQRNVDTICMFINTPTPLSDRQTYNPYLRFPREGQDLDSSLSALFGMMKLAPDVGEDLSRDHVFRRTDFAKVVDALQRAQRSGTGAVAAVDVVTVENRWWGIVGNKRVKVVFAYLGRVYEWEELLSAEVAADVAPHRTKQIPKLLPNNGTFKDFPHFSVAKLHLSAPVANALADMSAWVIHRNLNIFKRVIRSNSKTETAIDSLS